MTPPIWRRILVPADFTLYKLHKIIQVVFGWEDYHLHDFRIKEIRYGESDPEWDDNEDMKNDKRFKLCDVIDKAGRQFMYTYDFGDNWDHEIKVEKILDAKSGEKYPLCVAGACACPPEDVGGVGGYEDFLKIMKNPKHEEYKEMIEWIGVKFNPENFSLKKVNRELKQEII